VVICQPIGKEQLNTYRSVKQLAEKWCDQGLLVLRFDYAGMGDSAGKQMQPDAVQRWCDSIVEAVNYVRRAGAQEVALVGLQVGALLAAAAASRCGELCSLVLWDPVVYGRSYVNEELATNEYNAHEVRLGALLHATAFDELAAMSLEHCHAATLQETYVLVAVRRDSHERGSLQRVIGHFQADALLLEDDEVALVALGERIASVFRAETSGIQALAGDTVKYTGGAETLRWQASVDCLQSP